MATQRLAAHRFSAATCEHFAARMPRRSATRAAGQFLPQANDRDRNHSLRSVVLDRACFIRPLKGAKTASERPNHAANR